MSDRCTRSITDLLGWGDATFHGFVWENGGRDLRLHLVHASGEISGLTCHWASDLVIDLHWDRPAISSEANPLRRGGPLLTWECGMEPTTEGRWKVVLDFAHDGTMRFECESITSHMHKPPDTPMQPDGPSGSRTDGARRGA
jgi:hypothetical protein